MQAFRLSLENAMLFFEVCNELKADTEEKRLKVMNALVQLGKVDQITQTPKTKAEYIKHLQKHFNTCAIVPNVTDDAQQGELNG